jgi:hypothetical protein
MRARRGAALLALVALAGGIWWVRWGRSTGSAERVAGEATSRRQPPARRRPPPVFAPGENRPAAVTPALPESGPGSRYMRLYHGQSGRLANGQPFAARHGLRRVSVTGSPIEVWSSRNELDPGQSATLFARALEPGAAIEEAAAELRLGGETRRLAMSPRGDGSYAVELTPDVLPAAPPVLDAETAPPALLDAVVAARVRDRDGTRAARLGTLVALQDGGATFRPGTESIALDGHGNALLSIEVEVRRAGPYHAYAELWSPAAGRSLAFGRKNLGRLEPGVHRISLLFGGQILRDSGVDGPYAVRNLELLRVTRQRPHRAQPVAELMTTPPWRASDFH